MAKAKNLIFTDTNIWNLKYQMGLDTPVVLDVKYKQYSFEIFKWLL